MRLFKRILCTLLCFSLLTANAWGELKSAQTVVVEGEAAIEGSQSVAKEEAIAQANRLAVEQVLGVYVVSETQVANAVVIKDNILTKASGYVSGYKVLSSHVKDGIYTVKVEATVGVEPLVDQLAKMGLLKSWTVAIVLASPDKEQASTEPARTALTGAILSKGFKVADDNVLVQLNQPKIMDQILKGNYLAAVPVLKNNGVDVLIAGKAFTEPSASGALPTYGNLKAILTNGNISAKVIRVDTGEVIAAKSFKGLAGGMSKAISGAKAIEAAAQDAGAYYAKEIAKLPASTTASVQVIVTGVSFSTEKKVRAALGKVRGVKGVQKKAFSNKRAVYDISFSGKADQLADRFSETADYGALKLEITGVTAGRIDIVAK